LPTLKIFTGDISVSVPKKNISGNIMAGSDLFGYQIKKQKKVLLRDPVGITPVLPDPVFQ
jgi:hypothetical protein